MAIWIFLSAASIDRDYYALCFFGRVASRRSVYNALSVNCSVHVFRIFLSESSFLGRTFFWWLSGLRLAFGPSSGAPVWFRQSLPFLGRQIFFSLGLWLWTVSSSHNCLMASASRFYWFIVWTLLSLIQLLGRESSKFILDCLLPVDHLAVDQSEFSGR